MGIPQHIWLVLAAIILGNALSKDGEPEKGKYNFLLSLFVSLIPLTLLYCGGFFAVIAAPQIIYGFLLIVGYVCVANKDGQPKEGNVSGCGSFMGLALVAALFYWGGFFV